MNTYEQPGQRWFAGSSRCSGFYIYSLEGAIFYLFFGICFVGYAIRTAFNLLAYRKNPLAGSRRVLASIYILMGILWFSWFHMCFSDPVKMNVPQWLRYAGLLLFVAGLLLFILSHTRMKGFESKGGLVTSGIYSKIRNPMYLGFIIWIIGYPIYTRSVIVLASSPIWIAYILYWKFLEEKELEQKYEGYREYKRKTWF